MNWVDILATVSAIFLILYWAYFEYFRAKLGVSTSHSSRAMRQAIVDKIQTLLPQNKSLKILDPGCGTGDMVIALAKAFPLAVVIGLELSPAIYYLAMLKKWAYGCKNLMILKQDFLTYDYHECDCIVAFLPAPILRPLAKHLEQQLPQHAILLSNAFEMPDHWPLREKILIQKILNRYLFVYNCPNRTV